jgi:iron complex outermembrane receptor protein
LGARESRDERKLKRTFMGAPYDDNHKSFSSFDPSVTLDFRWNDQLHTYLSYAEAYRTGGFNVRSPANNAPYDAEKLSTYELGVKASWTNRLRANVALYRSDYKDIQLDFIEPISTLVSTVNAGEATIQGIELEVDAVPIDGLQLGFNYTYMDARQRGDVINPFTQQPLTNLSLPLTPHNKYNVSAEYTVPPFTFGTLSAHVDYSWDDKQTTNGGSGTSEDPRPSYDLLNARLELSRISLDRFGKLAVALWGKNLENKNYVIYRIYGADIYGEPRSYGIDLTYQF